MLKNRFLLYADYADAYCLRHQKGAHKLQNDSQMNLGRNSMTLYHLDT